MSTPAGKRHVASFEKKIALELGENVVTVEMVDAAGLKVKITFTIIRREKRKKSLNLIFPSSFRFSREAAARSSRSRM